MEKLEGVTKKPLPPDEMLINYIVTRQYAIKESITRNGSLRANFFRDIYEVERARQRVDILEIQMIKKIWMMAFNKIFSNAKILIYML
jgi:hypothetical protein